MLHVCVRHNSPWRAELFWEQLQVRQLVLHPPSELQRHKETMSKTVFLLLLDLQSLSV